MTLFGFIWTMMLLYCTFAPNLSYLIIMTIVSSTLQCVHVLNINGALIGPQVITSAAFALRMFLTGEKLRITIRKDVIWTQLGAFLIFMMAVMSLLLNHALQKNYIRILQLMIYVFCFLYMFKAGSLTSSDLCNKIVRRMTAFLAFMGFLQLGITSGALPRSTLIQELFYNDAYVNGAVYYSRNNYFRIMSTYMEPSYYAPFLVGAFFYFLLDDAMLAQKIPFLVMVGIQIILGFSSTAYGATFVMATLVILTVVESRKHKVQLIILGIVFFLVMYFFFFNILDAVIFSKGSSGSGVARYHGNLVAWRQFMASPIFGVGYKQARGSSFYFSILGQMGILGLACYLMMVIPILNSLFSKKKMAMFTRHYAGLQFAVLSAATCQMIAIPDLDICGFWMWMNLLALSYHSRKTQPSLPEAVRPENEGSVMQNE